jgi:hypothetical protein
MRATHEPRRRDVPDDDDLEAEGQEPQAQDKGFDDLPPATQAELKKLRKAEQSLRTRLQERDNEVLTAKYGEDIIAMIPEEVTAYERRTTLAEAYAEKFRTLAGGTETTDEATSESQEDRTEREQRLAAVGKSQGQGKPAEPVHTSDEIRDLMLTNPSEGIRAAQAKYGSIKTS